MMYDYTCKACNCIEERIVSNDEKDSQTCDTCQGALIREEFYACHGQLKGTQNPVKISRKSK